MRSRSLVILLSRDTRKIRLAKTQDDVLASATVAAAVTGQDVMFLSIGKVNLRDRVTLTQGAGNICKVMHPPCDSVSRLLFGKYTRALAILPP